MMARVACLQDRPVTAAITPELLAALRQCFFDAEAPAPEVKADDEEWMMYEFKVRRCPRARAHEWTSCPYAHPGEPARRRDPRRVAYSGEPCPDFRRRPGGACPRGAGCPFAHGTFEMWLHPSRYRTRPCRAGARCARPVCFFAHTDKELRVVDDAAATLSPKSTLTAWGSPPLSPVEGRRLQATEQVSVSMDMEKLMLVVQEINTRKMMLAAALPQATEDDGPDLGWVSDLLI